MANVLHFITRPLSFLTDGCRQSSPKKSLNHDLIDGVPLLINKHKTGFFSPTSSLWLLSQSMCGW